MGLKTCRICLAINVPMECLGTTIKDFIEKIFTNEGFPQKLSVKHYCCIECKAYLVKCHKFLQKAFRAQRRMYEIIRLKGSLTTQDIKDIDRRELGLNSSLSYHRIDEDFFVNEFENELKSTIGPECQSKSKLISLYTEDEVGNDNECYLEDGIIVKEEAIEMVEDPTTNATITCIKYDYNIKPQSTKNSAKAKKIRLKTPPITRDNIILGCRKRNAKYVETDSGEDSDEKIVEGKVKEKKIDGDYAPETEASESSESGHDSYDDNGRTLKKPEENEREYPRKCDHCNYVVEVQSKHYRHYLYCHSDIEYPYHKEFAFVCSHCGLRLRTIQRLRDHEATHGERTVKCTKCPAMFHHRSRMLVHVRNVHSKMFIYCDYCNKAFMQKSDLRRHIRTHTGDKPFTCHICGAAFAHSGNIGIHIKIAHQGEGNRGKNERKTKNKKRLKGKAKRRKRVVESDSDS